MSLAVVNAREVGKSVVLYRRGSGSALTTAQAKAEWVSYVRESDVDAEFGRDIRGSASVVSTRAEPGGWFRIGWRDGDARRAATQGSRSRVSPFEEKGVRVWEGDVDPVRRWLADSGTEIAKPRRGFLDIETDSRVSFAKKLEARVLSWVLEDDDGNIDFGLLEEDSDKAERSLLEAFWRAAIKFDQILAWSGDNFDFIVVRARSEYLGIRADMDRLLWLDQLLLYKKMNVAAESGDEKESHKLESIAQVQLGEGKDDFDASKTWEEWAAGGARRERMLAYNKRDVNLIRRIEEKTGFGDLFFAICKACQVFPDTHGLDSTRQMDGYMFRLGRERGERFPTKQYRQKVEKFRGAYVMQPRANGIERHVHVADFKSLYPSIMVTWNMSPETKRFAERAGEPSCVAPATGQRFATDKQGILTIALLELMAMRKKFSDEKGLHPPGTPEWKDADRKSTAMKVIANSFYGVVGSPFSRFWDREIAEAVTQNGRWLIEQTIEAAAARKMNAIYADTDSCFVKGCSESDFSGFVKWCNEELYPEKVADCGCPRNDIELAYEKEFDRLVFVAAKKYIGSFVHYKGKRATKESKPEVKGLEYKRSDATVLGRSTQLKVIGQILVGEERPDAYRKALDAVLDHVLNDDLPRNEVVRSASLSKPLKEYLRTKNKDGSWKAEPPHVQIARTLAEQGQDVSEGTRVSYYVVDGEPGKPLTFRDAEAYSAEEPVDRYYLWENAVYPPTQRLLESAFPDQNWALGLEKVRPPKPKRGAHVPENQLAMFTAPKIDAPTAAHLFPPYVLAIDEAEAAIVDELKELLKSHDGRRPLHVLIRLDSGAEAVLDVPAIRVSGSDAMERALWAARDWARRRFPIGA